MSKLRLRYLKTGKAKYISHLDLMSTMQRAFIRAGIELRYSEGFNPHPYMSVALPLSVGCESLCELLDVGIADDSMTEVKVDTLPEGIEILDVYKPSRKFSEITWIEVNCMMHFNRRINKDIEKRLISCFEKDNIIISKKSKRGIKELDIAPFVKEVKINVDDGIMMKAKISAQNPTINTTDLESIFDDELKPEHIEMKRIDIYDSNMVLFK